jgi:parallel beta-helix repeat protein
VSSAVSATSDNAIAGNVVSANDRDGVRIVSGFNNRVNGNTVTENPAAGVRIFNATASRTQLANRVINNTVTGNGNAASNGGIVIEGSSGQVVGATASNAAAPNTIADNKGSGVVILGAASLAANANTVVNNTVTGSAFDGVRIQGGLTNSVQGNSIELNGVANIGTKADPIYQGAGVALIDAVATTAAQANVVARNSVDGNGVGIRVSGGARNVVGGTIPALGNRVFASLGDGIVVERSAATGAAVGTVIRGNVVGLDAAGFAEGNGGVGIRLSDAVSATVDYGNRVVNSKGAGIHLAGGSGNSIGSGTAGQGNVIASNAGPGIRIAAPASGATRAVTIAGNTVQDNAGYGVEVGGKNTSGVTIGRSPSITAPNGAGNTIQSNETGAIKVDAAQAVTIIGNVAIGNGGAEVEPIVLVNGANGGVVAPTLASAKPRVPGQKTPQYDVRGTMRGIAGQRFYIDLYGNRFTDGKQFYLGRVLVTIGKDGLGTFRTFVTGGVGGVSEIAATATLANSLYGGTSEFSAPLSTG